LLHATTASTATIDPVSLSCCNIVIPPAPRIRVKKKRFDLEAVGGVAMVRQKAYASTWFTPTAYAQRRCFEL
jgi:hypothetical protein